MDQTGFFSRIAPVYDMGMRFRTVEDVAAFVGPVHGSVCEIGGGTGLVTQAILRANGGARGVVVDMNAPMLRRARKKGLDVVLGDAHRPPLRTGGADLVVIAEALHHFTDPEAALRESARVVRPGGRLFLDEFHPELRTTRWLIRPFERLIGSPFSLRGPDEVRALLEGECGLRLLHGKRVQGFRYWQLYTRP